MRSLYRGRSSNGVATTTAARFTNKNFVAVGDSITQGVGVTTPWPARLASALGTTGNNEGRDGQGWLYDFGGGNLTARAPAEVWPLSVSQPTLILFAGTNDIVLGSFTATQTYNALISYFQNALIKGYIAANCAICTCISRTNINNTTRAAYNALILGGVSTYGYSIVRLEQDARIGADNSWSNTTYFQNDGIHPNDTGAQIIADLVKAAMTS